MNKQVYYVLSIAANCVKQLDEALSNHCYCDFYGGQLEKVLDDLYIISFFPTEADALECLKSMRKMGIIEPVVIEVDEQEGSLVNCHEYKLFVPKSNEKALQEKHNSLNGKCYADFDDISIEYEQEELTMANQQKIILFLGLFDQDSKQQEISTLDAYKIASNLLVEIIGFGTITEAMGVYTHDDGTIVQEPTLRIEVSNVEIEPMKRLAIALKQAFNQESVAFEVVKSDFSFI